MNDNVWQVQDQFSIEHISLLAADSKNNERKKDSRAVCTHCGYKGHTVEKCYRLHGYPPGYRPRNASKGLNAGKTVGDTNLVAQLMDLLTPHMQNTKSEIVTAMAHTTGQAEYEDDWQG